MAIKLADTLAPMADFPAVMAEHTAFDDGETLQEKYETGQLGGGGGGYTQLSQAEYDALTEDEKMNGKEYRTYDTGHIYKLGIEYGKDADISRSEVLKTYVSLYNLNTKKGLSLAWENNVDNTQKIIDALEGREEFIDSFSSSTNRIGIVGNYGTTINNFHIIKRSADLAIITATTNAGTILNRTYTNGTLSDWCVNIAVYTSLTELGLTADATVEDVVNALKNGESFLAPVNTFTNYETMFPNKLPNDQWNKIHIIKGTSLGNSHIRCFSQSGACEYLANVNNTNIVSWNDVSGTYIDISDSTIEKLGNEILKYPVGKYRINSTATGNKFIDLPSDAEIKCGLIEVNGTAVGKSPFTDTWVYRMYKFECLTGTSSYVRRLNSGETVGQIEVDTGWQKEAQQIYNYLSQLGLTAPVSVGEIFNAMPDKSMAVIACEDTTDHITDVPTHYGVLTIKKNEIGRFSIDYQISLASSPCNVKRWIGTLKGNDGTGLYWKQLSAEPTFVTLNDIGLTADATFQDVIDKLPKGGSALLGVTEFTNYQTIFPYEEGNDQFGRVYIVKGTEDGGRVYARWFRKDGVKEAIAIFNINDNKFGGWRLLKNRQTFTSLTELGLTADATIDDVIGALKEGETALISTNEFTNYKNGMFPNQCANDQYAVIKVEKESGSKVFLEWRQKEGSAYAIGGLNSSNKFTNWDNLVRFKKDDFGDDSIVTIGDTVSADGAIQTLANLGFSNDIMTWKTGVYKVSHVSGLTNVPSDITATTPIFRLEHHNIKKWTGGHAPCSHTWAGRHSIYYAEGGNVYHRYTESGATAGTYTKDTGWQQIVTNTFNGQEVKSITIDLSASDLQSTGSGSVHLSLGNYIDKSTKAIRTEGYYNPPSDSTYPVVIPVIFGSQAGHLSTDSTGYSFRAVQSPSGKKGSGFVKIYYVE